MLRWRSAVTVIRDVLVQITSRLVTDKHLTDLKGYKFVYGETAMSLSSDYNETG